jgi:hypothetical protein
MPRVVLELRCAKCGTRFERSFEQKRRDSNYAEGEMIRLESSTCPNRCGEEWFAIEKPHPIRKFKKRF